MSEPVGKPLSVQSLVIYPVKSLGGIRCDTVEVTRRGFKNDRRWMIVDAEGRFVSQRIHPSLARLNVEFTPARVTMKDPEGGWVSVPLTPETGRSVRVEVWKDSVTAIEAEQDATDFITSFLGVASRLVYMPDESVRPVDHAYSQTGDQVSFADGYPILLTTTSSLYDLNGRLDEAIPMNRFRPNIVVSGGEAWDEDEWTVIEIAGFSFRCAKPSARCGVISVDQTSGLRQREPLRTLAGFRKRDSKVYFGINLIPEAPAKIGVGDSVFVHYAAIGG